MAHTNQGSTKGVGIQRRPPELPFEEAHSTVGPWMESEPGGVSPLEDLETDRFRHKETYAMNLPPQGPKCRTQTSRQM